ncbi:MAG: hypothetical protein LOX97_02870 [Sphingomonas sp.]|nr:hypothetical protein [Sphingomonas sp.]
MMLAFLFLTASAELQALDHAVARCDRDEVSPIFSAESARRSQNLLDAYTEQEKIVAARLALAERQRALRETDTKASAEEERAIRLEQALLDDRQRALNDQRMLEGIRQQTIDAMRRHYLSHCPSGKARN